MDASETPSKMIPSNLEAEEAVLGSLLIDPDAIIRVASFLQDEDFYREKHGWIYQAALDLHERREPVDFVTLCDELRRREQLQEVGGAAYITALINAVPTAVHIEHYAHIVERTAVLRRLISAAGRIAALAYEGSEDAYQVVDQAEQEIFGVSERRIQRELVPIKQVMKDVIDRIEYLQQHQDGLLGVPTGFVDLDRLLGGLQKSDLIIIAGRPGMGKSSLAINIALHAAKKHGRGVGLFSLEMSKEQLVQRLLASETEIDSQRLRLGRIEDEDWPKLVEVAGVLADAPIFIDDTPAVSPLELRTKARRLSSEHDLHLLIVDYLQLMHTNMRFENRVQEISYISRSMKALARELEVPLIAISQLSRSVESRHDKRPLLSDLRECLPGDTLIVRADTGRRVPIAELATLGQPVPVWSLDSGLKLKMAWMNRVFPSGVRQVFKIRTRTGRAIRASGNHPFLQIDGWKRLYALSPGDFIAVPRLIPEPQRLQRWSEEKLILLAHFIGDGCFVKGQPLHYTSQDPACLEAVELAASAFDVTARRVQQQSWTHIYLSANQHLTHGVRNPIAAWLDEQGIYGQGSRQKMLPQALFGLPAEQIALFLRHLWATDGCVRWSENRNRAQIYYSTSSSTLADDVRHLLLSLGINARVKVVPQRDGYTPQHTVTISGGTEQSLFLEKVGAFGRKTAHVPLICARLAERQANPNCDIIPKEVWRMVIDPARRAANLSWCDFAANLEMSYCGSALFKSGISRERMDRISRFLPTPEISQLAGSDVYWDQIESIEPDGEEVVYDGTVPGLHNFVANDFVVHNSGALEQDADVVIFIYRDDAYYTKDEWYDKFRGQDKPYPENVAEIIVAKHRHGPTKTLELYFHKPMTRFSDLVKRPLERYDEFMATPEPEII